MNLSRKIHEQQDEIINFVRCVCLDEWFNLNNLSCPLCREEIKNSEYQNEMKKKIG